jgi:PAS domain S-box-containing protein
MLAATFIALLLIDLAACWTALEVINGTRAYAVGEGRYAKEQKIAVLALERYIDSRAPADYDAFLTALAVPRGDRDARVALEAPQLDRAAAIDGARRGRNNPEDIDGLIRLFRYFSWWPPFAAAIEDWREADRHIDSLANLAAQIKAQAPSDPSERAAGHAQLTEIDGKITAREDSFSAHMSEAARNAKHVVVAGVGLTTAVLWAIGILFAARLFRQQLALDRQLTSSEQRFRDYAEVASDWYWEVDSERRITFMSELYFTLTGSEPASVLGRNVSDFMRSYAADAESWTRLTQFDEQKAIRGVRLRYPRADGSVIYLSVSAKPCFGEDGAFGGYRGVGSDITAAFEVGQSLREAKERAEIANRAKSEFLANMSHELRTPLNAIIGFSEIIMNRIFGNAHPDRYDSYARDINNSGRHLLSIIDEILDLSKIEAGREELDEGAIRLDELISSTRRLFNGRFEEAGLSLELDLPSPSPTLLVDATKLKQCLSNLLSNSIKFTPAGGLISISVRVTESDELAITVKDTGVGIAATDIPKVMSPFGQVEGAFQRAHPGTGLGLPLTRALIELHDGTFKIESVLGKGTAVTLTLPHNRFTMPVPATEVPG